MRIDPRPAQASRAISPARIPSLRVIKARPSLLGPHAASSTHSWGRASIHATNCAPRARNVARQGERRMGETGELPPTLRRTDLIHGPRLGRFPCLTPRPSSEGGPFGSLLRRTPKSLRLPRTLNLAHSQLCPGCGAPVVAASPSFSTRATWRIRLDAPVQKPQGQTQYGSREAAA
jgi:hypothetical protein